jgi:hypothetical protein
VYLIVSSGSKTEVLSEHGEILEVSQRDPTPGLGIDGFF